ncbi:hypothetical protein M407DRAFT_245511 [Tulasnella calospora MUT 4182]|uniref:Uncharacterized protein n=1 Tax=Tulasnella calospora MUT 4182 TaxID=1051891 RepID=A0A0C3Q9M2_9AGAM|nr:hypothetical protein M407DRAFT_245511 [Tulasnella calospora MUT 4182]
MNPERPNSPTPSVVSFRSSMHSERLSCEFAGRTSNTRSDMYMLLVDDEEQDRQGNYYKNTIHRIAQTLRSGGVLLLPSSAYNFFDENRQALPVVEEGQPGWTACQDLLTKVYELGRNGADLDAPSQWDKWLEASPFYTNVGVEDIYVPIYPWRPNLDMRCPRIAQLTRIDAGKVFPAFRPILTLGGMEPATADRWIATAVREVQLMRPKVFF